MWSKGTVEEDVDKEDFVILIEAVHETYNYDTGTLNCV